jgi:3-methyladenine DNA glycosylase AlkD
MNPIVARLRDDLKANVDAKTQQTAHNFFKEEIQIYGVKVPLVRKIAAKFWQEIRSLEKKEVFLLCEELFRSGYMEESFVVSEWLPKMAEQFEPDDIYTFKRWIETYVTNWAECDSFCNHTVGDFIQKFPKCMSQLKSWAKSSNRWLKRAAAVSLIVPAKKGAFLPDALEICDFLLTDADDMVQKGYGWLLKEESRVHQKEVFNYIMRNRLVMPRTALRYAIELMPKPLKTEAMKKA